MLDGTIDGITSLDGRIAVGGGASWQRAGRSGRGDRHALSGEIRAGVLLENCSASSDRVHLRGRARRLQAQARPGQPMTSTSRRRPAKPSRSTSVSGWRSASDSIFGWPGSPTSSGSTTSVPSGPRRPASRSSRPRRVRLSESLLFEPRAIRSVLSRRAPVASPRAPTIFFCLSCSATVRGASAGSPCRRPARSTFSPRPPHAQRRDAERIAHRRRPGARRGTGRIALERGDPASSPRASSTPAAHPTAASARRRDRPGDPAPGHAQPHRALRRPRAGSTPPRTSSSSSRPKPPEPSTPIARV